MNSMKPSVPITARRIETSDRELILYLADRAVHVPWERCSPALAKASPAQRREAELSPGGYGIHWPLIDEDLSVGGLLRSVGN